MLTVFMPSHNGEATLPRVLESYTRLTPPLGGWKLVVIDNGSTDATAAMIRSFSGRLPLTCLSEPRLGKNRALNSALHMLEGDLAVFSDDDELPEREWLVRLREVADRERDYAIFGGPITPIWPSPPPDWLLMWVPIKPVYAITDPYWRDGPCEPNQVWGGNMAVRAAPIVNGCRFNDRVGPDASPTYAMGSETEFTLRLTIEHGLKAWHCAAARVGHIISPQTFSPPWIFKRAFNLGRCVYREARQNAAAGRRHEPRDPITSSTILTQEIANLAAARAAGDERGEFRARWQVNLFLGCLFEAACTTNGAAH